LRCSDSVLLVEGHYYYYYYYYYYLYTVGDATYLNQNELMNRSYGQGQVIERERERESRVEYSTDDGPEAEKLQSQKRLCVRRILYVLESADGSDPAAI